jgi:phenylacetate-CoA ligase
MNEIEIARSYLQTLLAIERAPPAELDAYQRDLVASLYRHARQHAPFYRDYPDLGDLPDPASPEWQGLPYISRRDLAAHANAITASAMPRPHEVMAPVQTGGSTGAPVRVVLSTIESVARVVCTYRMFLAWKMDVSLPLYMLRKPQIGSERRHGVGFRRWGFPWLPENALGPRLHMDIATPPTEQLAAIASRAPAYVNTLPSNILRLGLTARAQAHAAPRIPIIISVAEYLSDEVRALAHATFGSRLINVLSSAEGGVIAIECPESGLLHIQSESVLAEIINETDEPCVAGEVGELVVTPLYNYAMPLIRYRTGDFVEKGPPCCCGRSLPTIAKIVGRREHMFRYPDGRRALPDIDRVRISQLLGHEHWTFVQVGPAAAELQVAQGGNQACAKELTALLSAANEENFSVAIKPVAALPLTSGGKRHFSYNQTA